MTYSEVLIKRIKTLCAQRGIAINKLAGMSGLNQSTLDNIVRGITQNPGIQTIHKIALGFGMSLTEFVNYKELNEFSFDEPDDLEP